MRNVAARRITDARSSSRAGVFRGAKTSAVPRGEQCPRASAQPCDHDANPASPDDSDTGCRSVMGDGNHVKGETCRTRSPTASPVSPYPISTQASIGTRGSSGDSQTVASGKRSTRRRARQSSLIARRIAVLHSHANALGGSVRSGRPAATRTRARPPLDRRRSNGRADRGSQLAGMLLQLGGRRMAEQRQPGKGHRCLLSEELVMLRRRFRHAAA